MVHALLILASETAGKSETPFFIAGGVFAVWAVIIGISGTVSETFPGSKGAGVAISLVSVLLAATAMGLAVYVAT